MMNDPRSRRDLLKSGLMIGAGTAMAGIGGAAFAQYEQSDNRWGWGAPPGQNLPPSATNGPWRNLRAVRERKVFDIHVHAYETPQQGRWQSTESGAMQSIVRLLAWKECAHRSWTVLPSWPWVARCSGYRLR